MKMSFRVRFLYNKEATNYNEIVNKKEVDCRMKKKLLYIALGLIGIVLVSVFFMCKLRNDKQDVWEQQSSQVVQSSTSTESSLQSNLKQESTQLDSQKAQSQDSVQSEQQESKSQDSQYEQTSQELECQQQPIEEFSVVNSHETTADINGDGVEEKIFVSDYRGENAAYTRVSAKYEDGSSIQIDFPDYWYSTIIPGDLNGDGAEEIVLVRWASGSTYGGGDVSILHAENGIWEKYGNTLIQNPMYEGNPADFNEDNFFITPLGGSIIKDENGQNLLRVILPEDLKNAIVRCIDCSYREDGWYIENVQIFSDFYGKNNLKTLLNYG